MFNRRDTALEALAEDMRQRKAAGKMNTQVSLSNPALTECPSSTICTYLGQARLASLVRRAPAQALLAALDADSSDDDGEVDEKADEPGDGSGGDGEDKLLDRSTAMSVMMQLLRRKKEQTHAARP